MIACYISSAHLTLTLSPQTTPLHGGSDMMRRNGFGMWLKSESYSLSVLLQAISCAITALAGIISLCAHQVECAVIVHE
jgi:hypothetical protein